MAARAVSGQPRISAAPPPSKPHLLTSAATGTLAVTMGSSILSAAMGSIKHDFPNHPTPLYIMGE